MKHELPMSGVVSPMDAPTMSSLEMVDYINADRKAKAEAAGVGFPCKKYRKLSHDNFLKKVPKVLGENDCRKFLRQYKDSTGRDLPCYNFPKREACLMALSYSYELQAQVFDRMTALEGGATANPLDLSGILDLTIPQMQDCIAKAGIFVIPQGFWVSLKSTSEVVMTRRQRKSREEVRSPACSDFAIQYLFETNLSRKDFMKKHSRNLSAVASGDLEVSCTRTMRYRLKCRHDTARRMLSGYRSS